MNDYFELTNQSEKDIKKLSIKRDLTREERDAIISNYQKLLNAYMEKF